MRNVEKALVACFRHFFLILDSFDMLSVIKEVEADKYHSVSRNDSTKHFRDQIKQFIRIKLHLVGIVLSRGATEGNFA